MYSWDDYYEPSEFEIQVEELKQSIIENVRDQIKNKIASLEKENAELQEIKKNWKQIKAEHDATMRELRFKTEVAEREAKRLRAKEILDSISSVGYRVHYEYVKPPKCDKCDDQRYIHFISPLGREMKEKCTCDQGYKVYSPKEEKLLRFYATETINSMYYSSRDSDGDMWELRSDVYKELPDNLEKINEYSAVFVNKEDCQTYCDWKNNNEKNKQSTT